jgi:hypothetical protein
MLNIEYKTETEEDMADLLNSLLMVRSTAFMLKKFLQFAEIKEGYNDLQIAFETIAMCLEPALTHITNEMMSFPKTKRPGKKPRKGAKR